MTSPKLSEIQAWLQWAVLHPDGVANALERNDPREPYLRCLEFIESTDQLSKIDRLQIYSNAYILRLREVLAKDFPITASYIGKPQFALLVEQYLQAHPPFHFNIGEVGRNWPKFIERSDVSKSMPSLSAVASLEWEVGTTYFSACLPPIESESLKRFPLDQWGQAEFTLDPTLRFLKSEWPLQQVWADHLASLEKRPTFIIIHRTEETGIQVKEVSRAQFEILKQLQAGNSLEVAISSVTFESSEDLSELVTWFRDWVEAGIIRQILTSK